MKGKPAELNTGRMVEDHAYYPRNEAEPWGLCKWCNMGEAIHIRATQPYTFNETKGFRCADCIANNKDKCTHRNSSRRKAAAAARAAENGKTAMSGRGRQPKRPSGQDRKG